MQFHTTITERGSFRSCRRRWYLETVEHLAQRDRVNWNLVFGEAIHTALEKYYTNNKRSLPLALKAFKRYWKDFGAELYEDYGGLFSGSMEEAWDEHYERGINMLTYYKIYDEQAAFDWNRVLAVNIEERAFVNILDPNGEPIPGMPLLSGRIDLVVERDDGIWIVDHKTAANAYDARALDVDDQLTGYCYIYWRLTGIVPRGALYNALIKNPPSPPRVLANGTLSKDKAQRTTHDLYLKAIKENDLDVSDYEDMLRFLEEKGWDQFFLRDAVQRNEEEILQFEKRLYYEYDDMMAVIHDPARAYPNPSQQNCSWCHMVSLCQAMEEQNPEFVKEHQYEEVPPRTIIPKTVQSPKWKGV